MLPSFSYEKNFRLKKYCFKDHTDWIKKTLNFLEKKNVKIIYKCHPIPYDPKNDRFNFKKSEENSENVIKSLYSKLPENLKIIYTNDNIHINDIIKISDFGVSYWSSSAIELAWQGKKSIICSNIHFANKEFVPKDSSEDAVIMFFYTEWCPHCKKAMPIWVDFQAKNPTVNGVTINYHTVDCDNEPEVAQQFGIEGYPTIKLKYGNQVVEYDAKTDPDTLKQFLVSYIN